MKPSLFFLLFLVSHATWAFSDHGHKLIAAAAWEQLTPYAKQNVERILGVGKKRFVNASVWADHIKSNSDFDYLKPLHYVNLPEDASSYDAKRDCKNNACVVGGILDFTQQLKSTKNENKQLALRMLIHLIGDIHQPLHAGLYKDRGGNWFEIQYKNKTVNLHRFWDNHAVKRFSSNLKSGTQKILNINIDVELATPEIWAAESHAYVMNVIYQAKENKPLTESYLKQVDEVMEKQLAKGAWRLAMWLNRLW